MIEVRELDARDFELAQALPLHRFDGFDERGTYLVAWDDDVPVGHLYVAWAGTELGLPELQDVYVIPERRNEGIGTTLTTAAEALVRRRGHDRCSLSVSTTNGAARRLYVRLGYKSANVERHVHGRIEVRGGFIDVDDTMVYLSKPLPA